MGDLSQAEGGALPAHELEAGIAAITAVLLDVASGRFDARAPRTNTGDALDVLAFLVNATAEEVATLVGELRAERDELRRAQAKLVHAAKLAALGELAGGVAHELNQPLTVILQIVELSQIVGKPPRPEDLELIRKAIERMARIVDGVRSFARSSAMRAVLSPGRAPVDAALELFAEHLRRDGVQVVASFGEGLPQVMADVDRLQQVLVNLLANARDALAERSASGEPRIDVGVHASDGWLVYSVADNGPGVAPEHQAHLFDPFFTTKDVGKGTGLGLSVSYGIVRDHGGDIAFEPGAGGGARFVLRIPAARAHGAP
jgi:C4-dicarboxylate-specific signal transduction histidine kinase